jgi:hypothetical protein
MVLVGCIIFNDAKLLHSGRRGRETRPKQYEIITVFFHFHTVFTQIIYEISYNFNS